ncbi:MAG: DUF2628 domain-containing protein [Candidatus Zixiibacteriota bacterium]
MKKFNIYTVPSVQPIAIPAGWSWIAFLSSFFWSCYYRVWLPAIVTVAAFIAVSVLIEFVPAASDVTSAFLPIMMIAVPISFGLHGNEWRGRSLLRRGYEHAATVSAVSAANALWVWRTESSQLDNSPSAES